MLESVLRRRWATMIDVGCAAGYYTTGFALRCPEARVIGFEGDDGLADLARRTAAANGVADRVEIRGFCEPDDLSAVLGPDTFVMLDVEGHEAVLADPQRVAGLAAATAAGAGTDAGAGAAGSAAVMSAITFQAPSACFIQQVR